MLKRKPIGTVSRKPNETFGRRLLWSDGEGKSKTQLVINDPKTKIGVRRGRVVWTEKRKKPTVGSPVWKDGEKQQHQLDVVQENLLPHYLELVEPNARVGALLERGPGTPFVTTQPLIEANEAIRRKVPILWVAEYITASQACLFPPGTLAIYLGTCRSPERRAGIAVSVLRHTFLIGAGRWTVSDVNTLKQL